MPDELTERISDITGRLRKVVANYDRMSKELLMLRSENDQLKREQAGFQDEIRQLEDQIFILKSSINPLDDEGRQEFEKRLENYIRAIDQTIALLKN